MKQVILAIALATTVQVTQAKSYYHCEVLGTLAGHAMQARQQGSRLSDLLNLLNTTLADQPELLTVGRRMAVEAYGEPVYMTAEHQQRSKAEFQNKWEHLCYSMD